MIVFILFLICLSQTLGIFQIEFDVKNECSVRLETEHGIETCLNQKCADFKDPWRVIASHSQDQPCYLHYLKLSFTTYDQFLVFIELQQSSIHPLEYFFSDDHTKHCMLEIEINKIYPFNPKYFLSEQSLNKLGGVRSRLSILQIEILNWYNSSRSVVQILENDLVDRQPFEQITIFYPCHQRGTMERLVVAKYLAYQERSSCPTQINVIHGDELLMSDDSTIYIQKYQPTHLFARDYFNQSNWTLQSINKTNTIHNRNANLFSKIFIVVIIVLIIILAIIYYYCCSSSNPSE